MSSTAPNPGRGRAGLLEKLLAAIRPEFRTEIYRPAADDPVLIVPPRAVLDCDRVVSQRVVAAAQGRPARWSSTARTGTDRRSRTVRGR
ncbi:hypothetical protein ACFWWB_19135 [Streptomyces sp. NPDC058690]|uniref:hypothetical protein n=1 Tax=Streptomyces sp. NPDC058690 TaxID=3346600 RepID=UPI0036475E27